VYRTADLGKEVNTIMERGGERLKSGVKFLQERY
jgi:hypothetical protein